MSKKSDIVEAAIEQLWTRGYHATGVLDIVQAAGVPKGSFYNHFASKEQLGAEVIDAYWASAAAYFEVLHDVDRSPAARLRDYFGQQINLMAEWGYRQGCMLGNLSLEMADHSPAIRDRLHTSFELWRQELATVIAEAQRKGQIRAHGDPAELAAFLLDSWEGAVLRARVETTGDALESFRRFALEPLLENDRSS